MALDRELRELSKFTQNELAITNKKVSDNNDRIQELEKELAEVKKYNLTQMDAQADSYMDGMTNNLTILESIGDIYMQILDLQARLEELTNEKVDK